MSSVVKIDSDILKLMSGSTITLLLTAFAVVIIAITVHEFMHGLVGYLLGDDTAAKAGRLSLNPLAHIDPVTTILLPVVLVLFRLPPFGAAKPVPIDSNKLKYDEFGMALVAAAGPLSNFALACLGGVILRFTGSIGAGVWATWWGLFISINVGFFVFNMIPFPPLDGSRILYAFAPDALRRIMAQIEAWGFVALIIFMFFVFQFLSSALLSIDKSIIGWVVGV